MRRIQSHPGTLTLRHTKATELVIQQLLPLGRDARMLVFGCSWGAEIIPFATSLPQAEILGVEIETRALDDAAALYENYPNVRIEKSDWATIEAHGPYDAVLCNAVLCRYPTARDVTDLSASFPFSEFEDIAGRLDAQLKPGGSLMIYNANYSPTDCAFADKYDAVALPPSMSYFPLDNFVSNFARDGQKIISIDASGPSYFVDVEDAFFEQRQFVAQRLNEGYFVKKHPSDPHASAIAALINNGVYQANRDDFSDAVVAPLLQVYRSKGPTHENFKRVPLEQLVRRLQANTPGNPNDTDCYEFSYWWDDQIVSLPRLVPVG